MEIKAPMNIFMRPDTFLTRKLVIFINKRFYFGLLKGAKTGLVLGAVSTAWTNWKVQVSKREMKV